MRTRFLLITILLLAIWFAGVTAQNLLYGPCSASYDEANDRWLIASSQNSSIVAIESDGTQSYFLPDLGSYVFGTLISGDTLYVTDSYGSIRAFDMTTRQYLWGVWFTGAHYTGGMAIDNDGFMYITDNFAFDSKIYKLDLTDRTYETFVASGLPGYTTHIIFDEPNDRLLLIGHYENTPIFALDPYDASLTPVVTPPTMCIGSIVMDNDRNVYISSYYGGVLYRYDQTFTNPPVKISEGYGSPCGIGYNPIDNILAIPSFASDRVDFFPLDDTDDDGILDVNDNCPDTFNPDQEDADSNGVGDQCCCGYSTGGYTGNTNCSEDGNIGLADISRLIDHVFISKSDLCCKTNGNTSGDAEGHITLADISRLIDHVFISKENPAPCL